MSTSHRERIDAKDIQRITGFGRTKAGAMYARMRKAKKARLVAENPDRVNKDVYLFIDDLVDELGIARAVVLRCITS